MEMDVCVETRRLWVQALSGGVAKFSVRGDGRTTATTAEAGVSAAVAAATHAEYAGSVLVSQAVRTSASSFWLFKVRAGAWQYVSAGRRPAPRCFAC